MASIVSSSQAGVNGQDDESIAVQSAEDKDITSQSGAV